MKRATQTADRFGMPYEVDERWIELSYGEWEGKTHSAVPSGAWARWKEDPGYVPEGGESLLTLDERVRAACAAIAEQASRSNVVVVSHVSPMKSAVAWALGVDIGISWNCHLDHASVCRISFQGTRPVLETFNETANPVDLSRGVRHNATGCKQPVAKCLTRRNRFSRRGWGSRSGLRPPAGFRRSPPHRSGSNRAIGSVGHSPGR